jgi:eukaryotic-like serine/threonine-protein kinase
MPPGLPAAAHATADFYEFGHFRVEPSTRSLYRAGQHVALTPKLFETLLLLVEEAGRVVAKEQLMERVWPGVVVEEGSIANNISALRKILNPGFEGEGPIATLARHGYRFTSEVRAGRNPVSERDTIVLADFQNKTGDPVFDDALKQALRLDLEQSPFLNILSERKVADTLRLMGRSTNEPVTGDVHASCASGWRARPFSPA